MQIGALITKANYFNGIRSILKNKDLCPCFVREMYSQGLFPALVRNYRSLTCHIPLPLANILDVRSPLHPLLPHQIKWNKNSRQQQADTWYKLMTVDITMRPSQCVFRVTQSDIGHKQKHDFSVSLSETFWLFTVTITWHSHLGACQHPITLSNNGTWSASVWGSSAALISYN